MNLTNLFNFKYLIQNFKKSKGLLILLTLIVPMFTSLMLLSAGENYAVSFVELSVVNIIFMYIIPVVLSMTLFGYVYKKNSVDFIGSMPLSRKTIFLTNTLGGIGIIIVTQLINLISTLFLSKVLSSVIIFDSMVWDVFMFFTLGYIFVFTVSNLAMSFSGNKFSQIVATCLILFLIPFVIMSGDLLGDKYSYVSVDESIYTAVNGSEASITIEKPYYFTAPSYIFDIALYNDEYEYSTESVLKMTFLSISYIVIGLSIFNRKKLELAGESYENINTHLIVKMLTFIPFMFVFCSLDDDDKLSVSLFFIAILAVYYFVFDLITNKKIKLKTSIPAFIVSTIVMFAIYEGIIPKFGKGNIDIVKMNDVETITIDAINLSGNRRSEFNLLVEDPNLVNLILTYDYYNKYKTEYDYRDITSVEIATVQIPQAIAIPLDKNQEKSFYQSSRTELTLKLKNGKTYKYSKYIDAETYENVIEALGNNKINYVQKNIEPLLDGIKLTRDEKNEMVELINKEISSIDYKELYGIYNGEYTNYTLDFYEYRNHRLIKNRANLKGFKDIYQKIAEISNKHTAKVFENITRIDIEVYENEDLIRNLLKEKNPELLYYVTEDGVTIEDDKHIYEFMYNIADYAQEDLIQFIKEECNKDVDVNKELIVLRTYLPTYFYSNNVEGFYDIILKCYDYFAKNKIEY